jgi:hypothetical protein
VRYHAEGQEARSRALDIHVSRVHVTLLVHSLHAFKSNFELEALTPDNTYVIGHSEPGMLPDTFKLRFDFPQ